LTLRHRLEVGCHDETHQPSNVADNEAPALGKHIPYPDYGRNPVFIDLQIRLQHSQKFLEAPVAHSIHLMELGLPLQFLYMGTPTQMAPMLDSSLCCA